MRSLAKPTVWPVLEQLTTLVYVVRTNGNGQQQVLLGRKKRGLGEGKLNGPGGKMEAKDECIEAAMVREAQEEMGITPVGAVCAAVIDFVFDADVDRIAVGEKGVSNRCSVFVATKFTGEPVESDEMEPLWVPLDNVPYDRMWPDDIIWLPSVLQGANGLELAFRFDTKGTIVDWEQRKGPAVVHE